MIQKTPNVTILAASISSVSQIPLVTFEMEYWRSIHAEIMTHRMAAKNAGSSRARPNRYAIEMAKFNPWGPQEFLGNQSGMQASDRVITHVLIPPFLYEVYEHFCKEVEIEVDPQYPNGIVVGEAWHFTAWLAGSMGEVFDAAGVHKQYTNRITEPFNSIKVVFTASRLNNIWALRCHPDAQPEFQTLAMEMKRQFDEAKFQVLHPGQWHMPYIRPEDIVAASDYVVAIRHKLEPYSLTRATQHLLLKMSAARCARASYFGFDGSINIEKDLELYNDLAVSKPVHASPFEHQATPLNKVKMFSDIPAATPEDPFLEGTKTFEFLGAPDAWGCLPGWMTHRQLIPDNFVL